MFRLGKVKSAAESFLAQYRTNNPATYAAAQQAVGGLLILDGFIGIDNPLGQKKRSGIFGSLVGIFLGIFFVFGIGFFGNLFGLNTLTATTTATVVGVTQQRSSSDISNKNSSSSSSCTVRARYTVNSKEYTQTATSGSSSACGLTEGQTIAINYDPNNPGAWAYDLKTIKLVISIFSIVGVFIAVSSLVTFVIRLLSILFGWKLLRSGRALAKTLPAGTDLSTIQNEIRLSFAKHLFGITGETIQSVVQQAQAAVQSAQPQAVAQPQPVAQSTQPQTIVQPTQVVSPPAEPAPQPTDTLKQ